MLNGHPRARAGASVQAPRRAALVCLKWKSFAESRRPHGAAVTTLDAIEQELQRWYVARQQLFRRWSRENERDPFSALATRDERRDERRRLERRIRELEILKRVHRAHLARSIDVATLCRRLLLVSGDSIDDE